MSRRMPFPGILKPGIPTNPQFGEPEIRMVIEVDRHGLMRTTVNKPLHAVQMLGLLLDCMQGQYQAMAKQASMLINPKGEPIPNGGEKEENNNGRGGDTPGSDGT